MAEKETKKPVMDVEKPGTTPASATSRPIIISKGPAMKDPMVTEEKPQEEEVKSPQPALPTKKKTIQPLTEQPKEAEETAPTDTPAESKPDEPEQPSAEETEPALPTDDNTGKTDQPSLDTQISEEERKRQELADKLVAEKTYFVPIGAVQKKRTVRNTTLLFAVFLIVVTGGIVAIDAELVQTNLTLPFDLIKN